MDWSAGERADAHQIIGVLREKFGRTEKKASREFVADYFRSAGATSVLDLWGGGSSAEAMRAAMPDARIVSVENGSVVGTDWFKDRLGRAVSRERLKRAHLVAADEIDYEARWGDVLRVLEAETFDAVWLDFCAQWSPAMEKIIERAGRSATILAVSVMPERDGLGSLGLENRLLGLAAIISGHADMLLTYVTSYQRNEYGQDMALLVFERRRPSGDGLEGAAIYSANVLRWLRSKGMWASRRLVPRKNLLLMKCAECDASFLYRPPKALWSSGRRRLCDDHQLRAEDRRRQAALARSGGVCLHCGERYEGWRRKFCTEACQVAHRRVRETVACLTCGSSYERFVARRSSSYQPMCGSCRARHGQPPQRPDCHPDREYAGNGLCVRCSKAATARRWRERRRLVAPLRQAA